MSVRPRHQCVRQSREHYLRHGSRQRQLSGTATFTVNGSSVNVPGTFAYTTSDGTLLNAGNGQSEQVTFTPTDSTDYATVQTTVIVNVAQATPQVAVNLVSITYGTALSNTQLSGSASFDGGAAAGTFSYTTAAGTVLSTATVKPRRSPSRRRIPPISAMCKPR